VDYYERDTVRIILMEWDGTHWVPQNGPADMRYDERDCVRVILTAWDGTHWIPVENPSTGGSTPVYYILTEGDDVITAENDDRLRT
jgi:hypothetical protein